MISASHPEAQPSGKALTVRSLPPAVVKACSWRYLCPNTAQFAIEPKDGSQGTLAVCSSSCLSEAVRKLSPVPAVIF